MGQFLHGSAKTTHAIRGELQRIHGQLSGAAGLHRPAHHLAREQVDDDGQIEPALPGPDIGYVGPRPCW